MRAFMRLRWTLLFFRYARGANGFVVKGNQRCGYTFDIYKDGEE